MPAITEALDQALSDDPFVRWLARPRASAAGRRAYVRLMLDGIGMPRGVVDAAFIDGEVVGAALWAPPHTFELGLLETIAMLPAIVRIVGFRRLSSVAEALAQVDAARPPEPRWLLTLIGTAPQHRRQGVGAALMHRGLKRCDAEGATATLETTYEPNLHFYERFGFAVTGERTLGSDGPTSWTLVRREGAP